MESRMSGPGGATDATPGSSPSRPARRRLLWAAGWLLAAISVAGGLANAWRHSQDFQWSPTRLLLHHVNPWQEALAGNPSGELILSQGPNYAHFLYLLMAPLGAMSFPAARVAWAICNLGFAALTLWLAGRLFQLSRGEQCVLWIVFLCGTPFRNTVGNGQQSLLVLALVALAYSTLRVGPRWLWFGLSYCKYSFAPPYFFDILLSRRIWFVLATFIPAVAGVVWAHWMVGGDWARLIVEPLMVGVGIHPSNTDWMGLVATYFPGEQRGNLFYTALEYGVPVLAAGALAWFMRFRSGLSGTALVQSLTAVYGVAGLMLFRHLGYDFVFLVFALALALKHRDQSAAVWVLSGVGYFWFVMKISGLLHLGLDLHYVVMNFAILCSMLVMTMRIQHSEAARSERADAQA